MSSTKTSLISSVIFAVLISITFLIGFSMSNGIGVRYIYLPFPVHSYCILSTEPVCNQVIFEGILISVIFWFIIVELIHKILAAFQEHHSRKEKSILLIVTALIFSLSIGYMFYTESIRDGAALCPAYDCDAVDIYSS